jgi:hypothetical protein
MADSADDFGENSYNSLETLALKSSLKRRSVPRVIRALEQNNYCTYKGLSVYGTSDWNLNLEKLGSPPKRRAKTGRPKKSSDSERESSDSERESSDSESPDPSLSVPESSSRGAGISREWDMLHGHDVQPVDEEAEFMKLAIDSANQIAIGRPSRYEFALQFICGVHKIPTEGQIKNWRKGIDEWMSFKPKQPKPDDVTAAILEYQGRNLTIATPYSLSNLYAIANPPNGHTPEAANIEDEEWRKQDWRKETVK